MVFKRLVVKSGKEYHSGVEEREIIWIFIGKGFCRTYEILSVKDQVAEHWWEDGLQIGDMLLMEIRDSGGKLIADPTTGFGSHPNFLEYRERAGLVFRREELEDVLAFVLDTLTE